MPATRSARLELRVTPAQKEIIGKGASLQKKTLTEYAVDILVGAALRDTAGHPDQAALGWMRGTATIVGDIVGPTEIGGWEAGELP